MNGFLLIDKPATWTSFDVCAKLRRPMDTKRIGHTGTLDPFATGLLVVAVGKATKLIPLLEKDRKTYMTTVVLGKTSETLDTESEIQVIGEQRAVSREVIEEILRKQFTGKIEQVPPKYSALKIDGKRAYELARQGMEVEMESRTTEVFRAEVVSYRFPEVTIELEVAAGFYVRSFARDLAASLGTVGMCEALRRTGVGDISMNNNQLAINNQEVKYKIIDEGILSQATNSKLLATSYLIDPTEIIDLPRFELPADRWADFSGGRVVKMKEEMGKQRAESKKQEVEMENRQKLLVVMNERTVGLGEIVAGNLQPRVVF